MISNLIEPILYTDNNIFQRLYIYTFLQGYQPFNEMVRSNINFLLTIPYNIHLIFKFNRFLFFADKFQLWKAWKFSSFMYKSYSPIHNNRIKCSTFFSWFGMIHLTKLGFVLRRVDMSFVSCSLYNWLTVRNIPFLVLEPNMVSLPEAAPMLTISAKDRKHWIYVKWSCDKRCSISRIKTQNRLCCEMNLYVMV